MSPARADQVSAVELAGRAAALERSLRLDELPRLSEAGALAGTRAQARLRFGSFEGRPTVQMEVEGNLVLPCQRCLTPCDCRVAESAMLMIVADDATEVAGGFEPVIGDPERLSVTGLIEEQMLLGMPLVPMHADEALCSKAGGEEVAVAKSATVEDRQRPFANLRELLDKGER
jgi:uncharacterized protein